MRVHAFTMADKKLDRATKLKSLLVQTRNTVKRKYHKLRNDRVKRARNLEEKYAPITNTIKELGSVNLKSEIRKVNDRVADDNLIDIDNDADMLDLDDARSIHDEFWWDVHGDNNSNDFKEFGDTQGADDYWAGAVGGADPILDKSERETKVKDKINVKREEKRNKDRAFAKSRRYRKYDVNRVDERNVEFDPSLLTDDADASSEDEKKIMNKSSIDRSRKRSRKILNDEDNDYNYVDVADELSDVKLVMKGKRLLNRGRSISSAVSNRTAGSSASSNKSKLSLRAKKEGTKALKRQKQRNEEFVKLREIRESGMNNVDEKRSALQNVAVNDGYEKLAIVSPEDYDDEGKFRGLASEKRSKVSVPKSTFQEAMRKIRSRRRKLRLLPNPTHKFKRRSAYEGKGLEKTFIPYAEHIAYEYYDDPNELCDRLRLLISSKTSGNSNHDQEINSILEELRESGIIE